MQWTNDSGGGYGQDPYGGVGYTYAHGHVHPHGHVYGGSATPHGDVLTVPSPQPVRSESVPPEPARPVFVDSSGRRQRLVLRAARLLVIPAGGYVALLISTMLGGPSISSPFVPQSGASHPAVPRATAPDSPPGTGRTAGSEGPAAARQKSGPAAQKTSSPTDRPTAATAPATTSRSTTITSPTTTPAPAHTSKGRANGSSHNPVK
ncbi:hypothetical protein [Streptomyces sp. NPDC001165]|uniref:hypothetical protein n=1 Tax=Streptomyces sp. NPDC001165 TaxID=3364546 RepID=UPI00368036B4